MKNASKISGNSYLERVEIKQTETILQILFFIELHFFNKAKTSAVEVKVLRVYLIRL